jgi:hypothetical protein
MTADPGRRKALGVIASAVDPTAEQLFNWAEIHHPQYFPSFSSTLTEGPWLYRSYMKTGVMLGINGQEVYVTGGEFGAALIKVGRVEEFVKPPIRVERSSYENKMVAGERIGPVELPVVSTTSGESLWSAHALADFFQEGGYALFAFSIAFNDPNGGPSTIPGRAYVFRQVGGRWVDETHKLLDDNSGCIGAHRLLVADFNGDGKPDVFATCSGFDGPSGSQPGEYPRMFLSQPSGRYKNVLFPFKCFCVGGATVDYAGKGFADIVLKDNAISSDLLYFANNGDGTFRLDQSRLPQSARVFGPGWSRAIYDVQIVDAWGTGHYDLILAGVDYPVCTNSGPLTDCDGNWRTRVYRNGGKNRWSDESIVVLPTPPGDYGDVYDVIVYRGNVYQLRVAPKGFAVQRVRLSDLRSDLVWEHRDYLHFASYTIQSLIIHGGKIVPLEKLPISIDP